MTWITGRNPTRDELAVIFERPGYTVYGARFLVANAGGGVWISIYTMPPRDDGTYYPGYWEADDGAIVAWMPLPAPPGGAP